ncbi:radical SAM protein [Candidatus Woesearchaeota archaeon]|nr:radical SAM protein [Candidatus Woesearchaeota archaeon]
MMPVGEAANACKSSPQAAVFQITYRCNYNCAFCLNEMRADQTNNTRQASFDGQKRIITKLAVAGVKKLVISGGEPMIDQHCADIIIFAAAQGLQVSLQTNGFFINDDFLWQVRGKIAFIQVSLEGTKAEHELVTHTPHFDRIITNMKKVIAAGIPLSTNFTITKQNHRCLQDYIRLVHDLGVSFANFTRLYHSGSADNNRHSLELSKEEMACFLKDIEAAQRQAAIPLVLAGPMPLCFLASHDVWLSHVNTCGAGKDEINIQPNGGVTMCPSDHAVVGNLLHESLEDIWNRQAFARIRERRDTHPDCKTCELFSLCGGGCLVSHGKGACKGCDVYMVRERVIS